MKTDFELLLCMDGHEYCQAGLSYGIHLAEITGAPVLLLCAFGSRPDSMVRAQLEETTRRLQSLGIAHRSQEMSGSLVDALERAADRHDPARGTLLTVYSTPRRSFLYRLLRQSTFEHLLAQTESPIIRLREERWPIRKILACSSGMDYTLELEKMINLLACAAVGNSGHTPEDPVQITFLHVAEPDTDAYHAQETPETVLEAGTPHALHMRQALESAHAAGLEARLRLRQGVAVHEILAEIHSGEYDLVGLGSSHSAESRRHTYVPSVTAQVALDVDIPVLVVRAPPSLMLK
jgi:nucleotide-binding universal stress UspA family protein